MDNAMENIKRMQDEIKNKVNSLDEKLKKVESFDFKKNDSLTFHMNQSTYLIAYLEKIFN